MEAKKETPGGFAAKECKRLLNLWGGNQCWNAPAPQLQDKGLITFIVACKNYGFFIYLDIRKINVVKIRL